MEENNYHKRTSIIWVRRLSKLLVLSTLFLIFAGALVKSHEVGLSVPDWPTSYGYQMFAFPLSDMIGGIFYEHGHRMIAAIVGFLTLILAFLIYHTNDQLWLKKTGFLALGLVIVQGLFGGLTVLFLQPTPISVIHALFAQTFFMVTILIAYGLSDERAHRIPYDKVGHAGLKIPAYWVMGLVYIQLIIGALMRHTQSGLAIPDFPLAGGYLLPPFNQTMLNTVHAMQFDLDVPFASMSQVVVHFLHRFGGVSVAIAIGWLSWKIFQLKDSDNRIYRQTVLLDMLLLLQITLGAFAIWSLKEPLITSIHVVNGATILGLSMLMVLRILPVRLQGKN
jgi:cytochrome c oxidase assembly protein subunit 15